MANKLAQAEKVLTGLLGLGLIGILYLVIFGNIGATNLGFQNTTSTITVTNENLTLSSVNGNDTFSGFNSSWSNIKVLSIKNATTTGGAENYNFTVLIANATWSNLTGQITNATTLVWNTTIMNYSYTHSETTDNIENVNAVIGNQTQGIRTFFSFSNTLFTMVAVTLLIGIILLVIQTVKGKDGFSGGSGDGDRPSYSN